MAILLADCDTSGHRSVIDLQRAGAIDVRVCKSFADLEGVFWGLYRGEIPMPELLVIDSITALASKTKQDVVLDPSLKGSTQIWSAQASLTANQKQWGVTGDVIIRLLRNFRELDCPAIFIAHEGTREDTMSGYDKFVPDLQRMILADIIAQADAILRLRALPTAITYSDGTVVPRGARQLLLKPTAESAVGLRDYLPNCPDFLIEPTLADFAALFGENGFPHNTIVYGPPKIGKTTFACNANRRTTA